MRKIIFHSIIVIFLFHGELFAFDNKNTHPGITYKAIDTSILESYILDRLNLSSGTESYINGIMIRDLIANGSTFEDEPNCRASNHFHNPLLDWVDSGLKDEPWYIELWCSGGDYPPENIKSAIHWATGYITSESEGGVKTDTGNQWDWDHAREYFYTYLNGKNFNGVTIASSESERETYLANSLQALGQVAHLLQDMAVPAHTRDDFKSHLDFNDITSENLFNPKEWVIERFEHYVAQNSDLITGITKEEIPNISITRFWDTDIYTGQDPDEIDSSEIGLAEFTNMNFASKNTIFAEDFKTDSDASNDVYYEPYPKKSSTNIQALLDGNLLPIIIISEDDLVDNGIYIKKMGDGVEIDKFLQATYFTLFISNFEDYDEKLFFKTFEIDDECAKEYAEILLPRAIGYSAALLDYFFRGNIDISAPSGSVYSIIDGSISPHQFTYINLKLRNNTSLETDDDGNTVYEAIGEGNLIAVAKYKNRTDYQEDLSTDPPDAYSREDEFSYSVSIPIEISSLDSSSATEFTFDFSSNPIPAGITDLYLQVIFKGTLGNETDNAIAVGMKDMNEPMHITESNDDDRVYLDNILRTADEIRADETLTARAVEGEIYSLIDPHNINTKIAFYSSDTAPTDYNVTYDSLEPGTYGRLILISDNEGFNILIHRESTNPLVSYNNYYQVSGGVINQMISDTEFYNTNISSFRGVIQHIFHGHVWYYPDNIGISTAPWPEMTGNPVTATTITP